MRRNKHLGIDSRLLMGDLSDLITPCPEIEHTGVLRSKVTTCVAFITYLECLGCVIQPPADYKGTMRDLLCRFFGINQSALQREKLTLLGAPCQEKRK